MGVLEFAPSLHAQMAAELEMYWSLSLAICGRINIRK